MKSCVISLAAPVENMNRILNSNRLPGGGVAKIGRGQTNKENINDSHEFIVLQTRPSR